jgi:hypothetical protein
MHVSRFRIKLLPLFSEADIYPKGPSMKRGLKVALATLSLTLFLSPPALGAPACLQAESGEARVAAAIQSIRGQYAAINRRAGRYRKIRKKLLGFSLEGGELVAYLDGPAVVKIVANHYGEGGRTLEEYYYANGKLIFVFARESCYDRPLSGKVVRTSETRFYFQNDRLIRWLDEDGKPVASGSAEYQDKQDEYLETSRKFADAARSKNSTIEA